jgi:septum formation protein
LVLASSSTARRQILREAGFDPEVVPSGADEAFGDAPTDRAVALIAARKAAIVAPRFDDALVLACDSMLDVGGTAVGKPPTPADAIEIWRRLTGSTATLYNGHCLVDTRSGERLEEVAATRIRFAALNEEEIAAYVATGEPLQMAGAFGLDGRGAPFVEGIEGDPSNVRGLSLPLLRRLLARLGLSVYDFWAPDGAAAND